MIIFFFFTFQYLPPTPAQQIIPHQVLLLSKHSHHDERVQVDALTQHPEVVTAKQVQVDKLGHFTARLLGEKRDHEEVYIQTQHDQE